MQYFFSMIRNLMKFPVPVEIVGGGVLITLKSREKEFDPSDLKPKPTKANKVLSWPWKTNDSGGDLA
jgi:hypothetical protein